MVNYKDLLNCINNETNELTETNDSDITYSINDIKNINTDNESHNLLYNIVQHPFIDNIIFDENMLINEFYIIIYRINIFNGFHYVEYYIDNEFIKLSFKNKSKLIDLHNDIYYITNIETDGLKKIKGCYNYNNSNFVFVQVRENSQNMEKWVNLWDIIINNYFFDKIFNNDIIDFFIHNSNISNLILNEQICLKPSIFYCRVDDKYIEYINKHKSIQYCQKSNYTYGPIIKLNEEYVKNDNVRIICFVDFDDFDDIDDSKINNDLLQVKDFIFDKSNNIWLFKNEYKLLIHTIK